MRINELLEEITVLNGQQYDEKMLIGWLNEIEAQAVDQVINKADGYNIVFRPYSAEEDMESQLMIQDQFRDVYINYIRAKIDFMNQETEQYNNDVAMYEASWKAYASWHIRNHMPKAAPRFRHF